MRAVSADRVTHQRSFRAMGTDIDLIAVGCPDTELDRATIQAIELAEEWENTFSRFRPTSELSLFNTSGGLPTTVSEQFLAVLMAALAGYRRTGGRFDPSILSALSAAGYDRDFQEIGSRYLGTKTVALPVFSWRFADIEINQEGRTVRLPDGIKLDFGGLAKGMFVDHLATHFSYWPGGAINAGGDVRVWGEAPDGDAWVIGVEDPFDPSRETCQIFVLGPEAQAIATSAMNRKVWFVGHDRYHHLIDPQTGQPIAGTIASATAVALDLKTAEIATKSLLISAARGESLFLADASSAVLINDVGTPLVVPGRYPDACAIHSLDSKTGAA